MANILIYNETNGAAIRYKTSVDTPQYSDRTDVLINPDVAQLLADAIPLSDWIVAAGAVREMTQGEKDARAAAQAAAEAQAALDRIAWARAAAKNYVEGQINEIDLVIRSLALSTLDAVNVIRDKINTQIIPRMNQLANQHAITPAIPADMNAITAQQLKNAIQNKIDDQSADGM